MQLQSGRWMVGCQVAVRCFFDVLVQLRRCDVSTPEVSHESSFTFLHPYQAESLLGICLYLIKVCSMWVYIAALTSTAFASVIISFSFEQKRCNAAAFHWCIARITCCCSIYRRRRLLSTSRSISRRSAAIWVTRRPPCVSSVAISSSLLVN